MILTPLKFLFVSLISGLFFFGLNLPASGQTQEKYKFLTIPDSISKVKFYPFGGYLLFGKTPPQLKEFYSLCLERTEKNPSNNELKIVGAVITSNDEKSATYRMEEVSLTDKSLSFKTEDVDNTHYEFSGKYLRKGDLVRFYRVHTPVLKGSFTKYSDGKIIYSSEVVFYFKVWKAESYYQPEK